MNPRDYQFLFDNIAVHAHRLGYTMLSLGRLPNGDHIYCLVRPLNDKKPSMLTAAAFHGEEPAGAWAILKFLAEADPKLFDKINLTFIPVVNPTGFKRGKRLNLWGENPNDGFVHHGKLSKEGKILVQNLPELLLRSKNCFLSLHEDDDESRFYVYTFETGGCPGAFTNALVATESQFFPSIPNGLWKDAYAYESAICQHCDGSFEDYLYHAGVPYTAATETPGLRPLGERVDADVALIHTAVDVVLRSL